MEYDRGITLNPPNAAPTLSNNTATVGSLTANGSYSYVLTYVSVNGETTPSASNTSVPSASNSIIIYLPIGSSLVIGRKIYRTQSGGSTFTLVAQINDNVMTSYVDTASDASISANQAPPTANSSSSTIAFNGIIKAKDTIAQPVAYNLTISNAGTQAGATLINTPYTAITAVAAGSSVILPEIREFGEVYWINQTGETSLIVFPPFGSEINSLGINASYSLSLGVTVGFLAVGLTQYVTI